MSTRSEVLKLQETVHPQLCNNYTKDNRADMVNKISVIGVCSGDEGFQGLILGYLGCIVMQKRLKGFQSLTLRHIPKLT